MGRESARAEETPTTPELAKVPPGDGKARRMWEPGAGGRRPGGSESARMTQGSRADLSSPLRYGSEWNHVERPIRTSRSREAELEPYKVQASAPAPKTAQPVTEKVRSGAILRKPTSAETLEQSSKPATRMGDPVLERWRPGGSVLALRGQGAASNLSLPPRCFGVILKHQPTARPGSPRGRMRWRGNWREPRKAPPRPSTRKIASATR